MFAIFLLILRVFQATVHFTSIIEHVHLSFLVNSCVLRDKKDSHRQNKTWHELLAQNCPALSIQGFRVFSLGQHFQFAIQLIETLNLLNLTEYFVL